MKRPFIIALTLSVAAATAWWLITADRGSLVGLFVTPDQQGKRFLEQHEFARAAQSFHDPMWQGTAWYQAGEFEKAAQAYARHDTAEAHFNQGNAWLLRGKYETAMSCYDRALAMHPDWKEARENRALADARADLVKQTGGDMGDQKLGADQIVFNKSEGKEGQDTELTGEEALSDQQIQALWLRRVQSKPADFLKAKFAYQQAMDPEVAK